MINNNLQKNIDKERNLLMHVMAYAVKRLCPEAELGSGEAIEYGFYYDFLLPANYSISSDILEKIHKGMKNILENYKKAEVKKLSIHGYKNIFIYEPLKLELLGNEEKQGHDYFNVCFIDNFSDICSEELEPGIYDLPDACFKLQSVSAAYWEGNDRNISMQRIYVFAFSGKSELQHFEKEYEDLKNRDHRKLGAELELFTFSDLVGRGLPLLLPKGAALRRILERFIVDEEIRRGYQHVYTPPMGSMKLYEISGHWEHYHDSMYPPIDIGGEKMILRPMSCPHHFMVYKSKPRSYRDLPMRIGEVGPLFRKERSGAVGGLSRIMVFTLADGHILCTPEQIKSEFVGAVQLIEYVMGCLGISSQISYRASLRDEDKVKYFDNDELWEKGEKILTDILDELGLKYSKAKGEAAFYGPKLDVQMKNVWGKEETVFTVQLDFCLAERFGLSYTDKDGSKKVPVIIHRSSIGCIERTMAFLIEYYKGAFPLWFSPVQARILTVNENQIEYAKIIESKLQYNEIRVESDLRDESLGKKIKEARLQRIPYLLIIGDKEMQEGCVTVRNRDTGEQHMMKIECFAENAGAENRKRSLKLEADEE